LRFQTGIVLAGTAFTIETLSRVFVRHFSLTLPVVVAFWQHVVDEVQVPVCHPIP
jgi:hypothetical protein